ncbi:prolyl oligopeptidase family serine peptidase [Shinella sp.]|uniref:prolyl oligopeptidase family serine peptidase n=1 Tax=Shinella sp. TaxID=1870904 RepID=UPI003F6F1AAE
MTYPETKRVDVVDNHFGTTIADPYRWLENDVRRDPDVAAWIDAQNRTTRSHLADLPGREVFRARLTELFDFERLTAPDKKGNRYFFTRNSGLANQETLVVREGLDGQDRVLIDPNSWSEDGANALAEWSASEDGKRVAFATQEGGTDWRTIRVLDVETGAVLEDEVAWVRFTSISWATDGTGFFYSRFPEPEKGKVFEATVAGHAVYFHALGTPQSQDRLVYATPEQPHLLHFAGVTEDGRYIIIYSSPGSGGSALTVLDLTGEDWKPHALVEDFEHYWSVVGNVGTKLFLTTQKGAERGKIVALDLGDTQPDFTDIVAESEAVLSSASLLGGRLIVCYFVDAKTKIERFKLDGTPDGVIDLPGIGSAGGFHGRAADDEAFFVFTSHNAPTTIYRYDVAMNTKSPWAEPKVAIDLDRIVVEQRFYASKDGTKVPMFIVRRKDVTGPAPTLLYGYGGFAISMIPFYSPASLAWVEQGGVFAVASIRGGGEYGKSWHDAGRRENKQNVFDDFIAAGEYLKAEGITSPDGLAIQGESNGGLLVGAVVNQRPDLFAAALPGVGVMDMLRFHLFTGGQLWMQDFGDPAKESDFRNLLSYSPYHTIQSTGAYPAILVTTADTDDRVVPGHSFKYVAALQAADLGARPRLLRVDTRAGHGAGKPTDKMIEEFADMWAFAARWTGLEIEMRT